MAAADEASIAPEAVVAVDACGSEGLDKDEISFPPSLVAAGCMASSSSTKSAPECTISRISSRTSLLALLAIAAAAAALPVATTLLDDVTVADVTVGVDSVFFGAPRRISPETSPTTGGDSTLFSDDVGGTAETKIADDDDDDKAKGSIEDILLLAATAVFALMCIPTKSLRSLSAACISSPFLSLLAIATETGGFVEEGEDRAAEDDTVSSTDSSISSSDSSKG